MRNYSSSKINAAGEVLKDNFPTSAIKVYEAEDILTYWRYIHLTILNTFQATLRTKLSKKYKKKGFIAQRLKRSTSIVTKLQREPNMKLSTMQDIAGIRAVLSNLEDVFSLQDDLKKSRSKHILKKEYDYITNPKIESGYRSIHLIFQYVNLRQLESNGLKIEVQLRTKLQHIWATTVETIDTFLGTQLKSNFGPEEIKEFFKLTSSAFAIIEQSPLLSIHAGMEHEEIFKQVIQQYDDLKIDDKLKGFTVAADKIKKDTIINKYHYYIVQLEIDTKQVTIKYYSRTQLSKANREYTRLEREILANKSNSQVVLVSTDKISALTKAYPNYFLDTKDFISIISRIRKTVDG